MAALSPVTDTAVVVPVMTVPNARSRTLVTWADTGAGATALDPIAPRHSRLRTPRRALMVTVRWSRAGPEPPAPVRWAEDQAGWWSGPPLPGRCQQGGR